MKHAFLDGLVNRTRGCHFGISSRDYPSTFEQVDVIGDVCPARLSVTTMIVDINEV